MNSWDDAAPRGRPAGFSGDWRGSKPSFDDPMSWALPVLRVAGISVRVHLFFLAFVLAMIARAASVGGDVSFGLMPTVIGLCALFLVVLLHEFGHCIACRAVGGRADEILLWPLGGLASCAPPERPSAHLWTAVGGPLVNVGFIAVLTPLIGFSSGQWLGLAVPDPFDLGGMVQRADIGGVVWKPLTGSEGGEIAAWVDLSVLLLNYVAWALLLFNLIPMFPLDGGRIMQALLWKRHGYARSMRIACRSGLVGAVILGVFALASDSTTMLAIALFGGVVCFTTAKQVELERDYLGFEPDPAELAAMEEDLDTAPPTTRESRSSGGRGSAAAEADAEIDAILEKIAKHGIGSLTAAEREALSRATERRRGSGRDDAGDRT
jgi:Zn-dependent protease